jgi:hypothetical protein
MDTTTDSTDVRTITVDADMLATFKGEVARLNKIAAKLNVAPLEFRVVSTAIVQRQWPVGPFAFGLYEVKVCQVEVTGSTPRLPGGWTLVGVVEHAAAGNLVHGDDPRLAVYREAAPDCDHCGVRRDRSKTIVVEAEDGRVARIGTSCMKDFLGFHGSPERVLSLFAEWGSLDDDEREWRGGRRGPDTSWPAEVVLALGAAIVRCRGFVSRAAADGYGGDVATVDIVRLMFGLGGRLTEYERELLEQVQDSLRPDPAADLAMVADLRAWAAALPSNSSEYLWNLRTVLAADFIEPKHWALAVSGFGALARERDRDRQRAVEAQQAAGSEHVGTVGGRLTIAVTVERVRLIETNYGPTMLVIMVDPDGNRIKTFASGSFGRVAEQGWTGVITTTVKKHETYNGVAETVVTRTKVAS